VTPGRRAVDADDTSRDPLRILVVCTGNICRSPLAAHLLARALAGRDVEVRSAGTTARPELPMHPQAERSLVALAGSSDPSFRSRSLTAGLVATADLVLTAERAHRDVVAALERGSWARTFTLVEFARLVGSAGGGGDAPSGPAAQDLTRRAVLLRTAAAQRRALLPPARPADDDVEDPMGRTPAVFERSAVRIARSVSTIAAALLDQPARPAASVTGSSTPRPARRWTPWR
jgi:protein-tyrosine phosphatase